MSKTKKVYVVVISNQDYHFDDEQKSHLPEFRPVLGVYKDFNTAHKIVFLTFQDENSCKYEELRADGNTYEYNIRTRNMEGMSYTPSKCVSKVLWNKIEIRKQLSYGK